MLFMNKEKSSSSPHRAEKSDQVCLELCASCDSVALALPSQQARRASSQTARLSVCRTVAKATVSPLRTLAEQALRDSCV